MSVPQTRQPALPAPQWQRFALIFSGVAVVLIAGYFLLLRQDYSLLFDDLSPTEASLVIAELEAMEVAFRIAEGGRAVEVPAGKADELRLKIAGSTSVASSLVGFELFNESDMGMTEFAQKIKYQRAIQGELARSILLIEGIENARVHIAVPERATFRSEQAAVTASVTLVLKPGTVLAPERVNAIRHLVAASVPGLSPDAVTILDQNGSMIAATVFASPPPIGAATASGEPRNAHPQTVTGQLSAIVADILPGSAPEIILSLPTEPEAQAPADGTAPDIEAVSAAPARMVLITDYAVSSDAEAGIRAAAGALMAAGTNGLPANAEIVFLTRQASPAMTAAAPAAAVERAGLPAEEAPPSLPRLPGWALPLAAAAVIGTGAVILVLHRLRSRYALSAGDRRVFAELINSQIALAPGQFK